MSFVHTSGDFIEIRNDDELLYLLFPLDETHYCSIDRHGVFRHLVPVELLQHRRFDSSMLPMFDSSYEKKANAQLIALSENYFGRGVAQLAELKRACSHTDEKNDPWIAMNSEASNDEASQDK